MRAATLTGRLAVARAALALALTAQLALVLTGCESGSGEEPSAEGQGADNAGGGPSTSEESGTAVFSTTQDLGSGDQGADTTQQENTHLVSTQGVTHGGGRGTTFLASSTVGEFLSSTTAGELLSPTTVVDSQESSSSSSRSTEGLGFGQSTESGTTTLLSLGEQGTTLIDVGVWEEQRDIGKDAEFLIQATFGPTRASLADIGGKTYEQWVVEQQAMAPSSHRAYYRERVNPKVHEPPRSATARGICEKGARFHRHALTRHDIGQLVSVQSGNIYVGGVLRSGADPTFAGNGLLAPIACTDTPPSWVASRGDTCADIWLPWVCRRDEAAAGEECQQTCFDAGLSQHGDDCSQGWTGVTWSGYVCTVDEVVGGLVQTSTQAEDCEDGTLTGHLNPAIWFADGGAAVSAGGAAFAEIYAGQLVLSATLDPCTLGTFIDVDGQYYMHDERMFVVENTLENPNSGTADSCHQVPKTFLNAEHCKLQPACAPLQSREFYFQLNYTTLELMYVGGGRYVYAVDGLRPADSPCGGSASWWKMLDCGTEDCTGTSLSGADETDISNKLASKDGWHRSITASCSAVPAGAVVKSGDDWFQHVHRDNGKVYDFSAWVSMHPGGPDKITKWVTLGFKLDFPAQHHMEDQWESRKHNLEFLGRFGEEINFQLLSSNLQSALIEAFGAAYDGAGYMACGSPEEVGSDPLLGHKMTFFSAEEDGEQTADFNLDNPHDNTRDRQTKSIVWTELALYAPDQLRQRMAWALSQIYVVGSGSSGFQHQAEMWVTYYSIFTRNAFGNLRDILQEVTYSPMMGFYLTYRGNLAYDYWQTYPDENFAREIMQLFTIGLFKLNKDGTRVQQGGNDVPTYTNEDIMDFARVFTGLDEQLERSNVEQEENDRNKVDPMMMVPEKHDVYPKMDLDGNYIGDGYPLCNDLPPRSFLQAGARYEFRGYALDEDEVHAVDPASGLYGKLLPVTSLVVTLDSTVTCTGSECSAASVRFVKVGTAFYEYIPPSCVYLYFAQGQIMARGNQPLQHEWHRVCANSEMPIAGVSCCSGCHNTATSWMDDNGYTCEEPYSSLFTNGCTHSTSDWWQTYKWCQLACWQNGAGYEGDDCSAGALEDSRPCFYPRERLTLGAAQARCQSSGMAVCEWQVQEEAGASSCDYSADDYEYIWTKWSCQLRLKVYSDGKVSLQSTTKTQRNRFRVQWLSGHPDAAACPAACTGAAADEEDACECDVTVETQAVFDSVPTKADVLARLKIGAHTPGGSCTECSGDVIVYSGGVIDDSTVFEVDGAFYRNVESLVDVGGYKFRNTPVFNLAEAPSERAANAEVGALLDHLFRHPNVPPFIAYRLIQRFVTSNPSPQYVQDVAEAFTTGSHGGEVYSGQYGDLGAAIAAVLLHPEARSSEGSSTGVLREPLLKVMHVMRSMEYRDSKNRSIQFRDLMDEIGQWPYEYPSVFNFYLTDFQPTGFATGYVAPEFEIFTPPLVVGFLNGMMRLINDGLAGRWCSPRGWGDNVRDCYEVQGQLSLPELGTVDETLQDLNVLLTGGRTGDSAMTAVKAAYEAATEDDKLKAALRAMVLTPEFHTLGAPLPAGDRAASAPEAPAEPTSYKAVVMLFLDGGADTFNMIVPLCQTLWAEYVAVRTDIALEQSDLDQIEAATQACSSFGVHGNLPFLTEMYNNEELAFVTNVGALVEPMTVDEYFEGSKKSCVGLFSHSDQKTAAQTLKCQVQGASPRGMAGRMADALAEQGFETNSFSVAGLVPWARGFETNVEIIDANDGAKTWEWYSDHKEVMEQVTNKVHDNIYCEEYVQQLRQAVEGSEELAAILNRANLTTTYEEKEEWLGQQLRQVARLIATRKTRKVERETFFTALGGFDTHSDTNRVLGENFEAINTALSEFVAELKGQGVFDDVVVVMASEFARTLTSNGQGTDHAWAGNYFVFGGDVRGKQMLNNYYSSLAEGSEQDTGRGRMLPKHPWENLFWPIAKWMGVEDSKLTDVFPNRGNFNEATDFVAQSSMFRS